MISFKHSQNKLHFGFMPGHGTTDAIFIVRQKSIKKNQSLFFAFAGLEKVFDKANRRVTWWALGRVCVIPEWIARVVQTMLQNSRSQVRINNFYSDAFDVQVDAYQGSVLFFEVLFQEFHTFRTRNLLCANDLVILANTMDQLLLKLELW